MALYYLYGNIYLFGGTDGIVIITCLVVTILNMLLEYIVQQNDVWEYKIETGEWYWIGGK